MAICSRKAFETPFQSVNRSNAKASGGREARRFRKRLLFRRCYVDADRVTMAKLQSQGSRNQSLIDATAIVASLRLRPLSVQC